MRTVSSLEPLTETIASAFRQNCGNLLSLAFPKTSNTLGANYYEQVLEACVVHRNFILGRLIHSKIVVNGLQIDSFLSCKLIGLYSLSGDVSLAKFVLNQASSCNPFLMNAMIRGYSMNELYQQALDFFYQTTGHGVKPDSYTFSCILKVCTSLSDLQLGKKVHSLVFQSGLESDLFVSNALIAMYAKCGSLFDGISVFERMPERDVISWNSIISAYSENGYNQGALDRVRELARSDLRTDDVTIITSLTISSSPLIIREIHAFAFRKGFESISMVCNSLVTAYGQWGRIEDARKIFDNMIRRDKVTWNSLICSYAQNGFFEESVQLLQEMQLNGFDADVVSFCGVISSLSQNGRSDKAVRMFKELLSFGVKADVIAIVSILPAIADLGHLNYCKEIHSYSYRNAFESDRRVRNALVSVYSKCGFIPKAVQVFKEIQNRDVISWGSMIVGFAENGDFDEALKKFREMIKAKMEPNPITITSIISVCAGTSSLKQGREIHLWAFKNGLEGQTFVGSALIDMYSKCGRIIEAQRVFDLMQEKNSVSWNSLISGYAVHGFGHKAVEIFKKVKEPDQVSFLAALSACSHGGLVDEGIRIFNSMKSFSVAPREGHYSCMVDILGRSGRLEEALELIKSMPTGASADIWAALLGACKIHSNLDIGIRAGTRIIELGCENPGYYVLFSNLMADFGKWEDVQMIRKKMKEMGTKKGAGCSWIEVNKEVHSFVATVKAQHPEWECLFLLLKDMDSLMKG
ncbi:pentatricopeptide repeat-containing protein At1g11290, chloroplastic-like [Aristolochia californica]|uniref:pentatricopeptide repeat-containing protein At1g11290, chloroplastic-like n=1 Tax=Aristolochia californica TaxID=171875 RepID=UPI0035E25206